MLTLQYRALEARHSQVRCIPDDINIQAQTF